jgi:hypothetical protein
VCWSGCREFLRRDGVLSGADDAVQPDHALRGRVGGADGAHGHRRRGRRGAPVWVRRAHGLRERHPHAVADVSGLCSVTLGLGFFFEVFEISFLCGLRCMLWLVRRGWCRVIC